MRSVWVDVKTETTISITLALTVDEARSVVDWPNNNPVLPAFVKLLAKILKEDHRIPAQPEGERKET